MRLLILIILPFALNCQNLNRTSLKAFDASLSGLITGSNSVNVVLIADSWGSQDKIHQPIATNLKERFGDAGAGYCGTNSLTSSSGFNQTGNYSVTRSVVGNWGNISQKKWILSANISADSSSTVGDSITFTGYVTNPIIHYMQKSGGGDFVYRIDGTNPTTVSTNGTNSLISLPTYSVPDGQHKISIKVISAGNGVTINGVELNRNKPGIRVHNLAVAGSKLSEWVNCDSVTFQRAISGFSPSLVIISLGVNDSRTNTRPETAIGNLNRIVNRILDTIPNVSICIFSQADICDIGLYWPMSYYVSQMKEYAISKGICFVDSYSLLGPCSTGTVNGVYQDNQHLNYTGGDILKRNFLNYLVPYEKDNSVFTTEHYHNVTGPFNNITYFFDRTFNGIATTSGVVGKMYIQWDATLVGYSIFTYVAGTLGSSENQSYYVRINNSTDVTLTTTDKVNSLSNYSFSRTLNHNVSAGDYIEIKGITPAMSTAPTSVSRHVILYWKKR